MTPRMTMTLLSLAVWSLTSIPVQGKGETKSTGVYKPFLSKKAAPKVPDWVAHGLVWPSKETIDDRRIGTGPEARKAFENDLAKVLKPPLYDPNIALEIISLEDWPRHNAVTRNAQFDKGRYILRIKASKSRLFIGIKKEDNEQIWNLKNRKVNFLHSVFDKFFKSERIGVGKDKKVYFAESKTSIDSFYCSYLTRTEKGKWFWPCYIWTNGKVILLRLDILFRVRKGKIAAKEK